MASKIRTKRWLSGVARQNQQYWYRCVRLLGSKSQNVFNPTLEDLKAFFCEKLHFESEQFAPLRL